MPSLHSVVWQRTKIALQLFCQPFSLNGVNKISAVMGHFVCVICPVEIKNEKESVQTQGSGFRSGYQSGLPEGVSLESGRRRLRVRRDGPR